MRLGMRVPTAPSLPFVATSECSKCEGLLGADARVLYDSGLDTDSHRGALAGIAVVCCRVCELAFRDMVPDASLESKPWPTYLAELAWGSHVDAQVMQSLASAEDRALNRFRRLSSPVTALSEEGRG